ncbi:MAG: aminotransferase class IV [Sinobacteraceae bacterium]|nr:aminotransferase class IV [Nevskiaceae bacterium]
MAGSQDFETDARNEALLILLDGELVPAQEARVSVFDSGFGMGDGIWEGLRLHRGSLLFLEEHLERLWAGAAAIRLDVGLTRAALVEDLRRLLRANDMKDGVHVRLMVTRGRKRTINQDPRTSLGRATVVATAEYKQRSGSLARGLALATVSIRTSPPEIFDMRLNSHSRLNLIRALLEAIEAGADEALMLDPHGHVASCNATNLFWVKAGDIYTSREQYCFNGITRGNVISACLAGAAPLHQGGFPLEDLRAADEVFVTGTMGGITPVRSLDRQAFPAVNGPVTQRVAAAYEEMKDRYAREHPLW